jgi:hypothetical protein
MAWFGPAARCPVKPVRAQAPSADAPVRKEHEFKGLEMAILVRIWGGRQLYVERDVWSTADRFVEWRTQREEWLIWFGRWHVVWTPARSGARRLRAPPDGRTA